MREADLTRELALARDDVAPADQHAGRAAVERKVQTHHRQRIAAVFTVMVILVGGVALGLSRGGAEEQGVITTPDAPAVVPVVPRLIPTDIPETWQLTRVLELPTDLTDGDPTPPDTRIDALWTDGVPERPDPAARVVMVTSAALGPEDQAAAADVAEDPEVSTRTSEGDSVHFANAEGLKGDRWVSVIGRNTTEDDVRAIYASISIDADGKLVIPQPVEMRPAVDDASLDPAAPNSLSDGWYQSGSFTAVRGRPGYAQLYDTGTGGGEMGSVVVTTGRPEQLWLSMLFASGPVAETTFDGAPAFFIATSAESCTSNPDGFGNTNNAASSCETTIGFEALTWFTSDGAMITVQATNQEEALRIARSLVPVDDAAWDAFAATAINGSQDEDVAPEAPILDPSQLPPGSSTTSLTDDMPSDQPATTAPPAGAGSPPASTNDG